MKPDQMTFRCTEAFKEALDRLRKREADLPSRTVMLHRLVERAEGIEQMPHSAKSLLRQGT